MFIRGGLFLGQERWLPGVSTGCQTTSHCQQDSRQLLLLLTSSDWFVYLKGKQWTLWNKTKKTKERKHTSSSVCCRLNREQRLAPTSTTDLFFIGKDLKIQGRIWMWHSYLKSICILAVFQVSLDVPKQCHLCFMELIVLTLQPEHTLNLQFLVVSIVSVLAGFPPGSGSAIMCPGTRTKDQKKA